MSLPRPSRERVGLIIPTTIPKFTGVDRERNASPLRLSANSSSPRLPLLLLPPPIPRLPFSSDYSNSFLFSPLHPPRGCSCVRGEPHHGGIPIGKTPRRARNLSEDGKGRVHRKEKFVAKFLIGPRCYFEYFRSQLFILFLLSFSLSLSSKRDDDGRRRWGNRFLSLDDNNRLNSGFLFVFHVISENGFINLQWRGNSKSLTGNLF